MLFNSFSFIVLFSITLFLYYLPLFRSFQIALLILSSLIFYAYHSPELLILLLASVAINTGTSYYVTYGRNDLRKLVVSLGVALNLSVLAFFKYSPLFAKSFLPEASSLSDFLTTIPLPIGISFFTFEGISLLIDVYKGNYFKGKDFVPQSYTKHTQNTLFFVSFFPHLIAGPILKAHEFFPQIVPKNIRDVSWESVYKYLVLGYFLKMVVADNLKEFTNQIEFPFFLGYSSLTLITLLIGYSFQIFADFAGYSLIAIGLAASFGYKFNINFNFPYISSSFKEFWKRWHISLSSFLMEYLYIPLGGNRKGEWRTYFNLLTTMVLGGLWHGAAWSYALWGAIHGLFLAGERLLNSKFKTVFRLPGKWLGGLLVFSVVTMAWLLFKLPDFSHVIQFVLAVFRNIDLNNDSKIIANIIVYSFPVIVYHLFYICRNQYFSKHVFRFGYLIYGLMMFLILTNSGLAGDFIYFQF